MRQIRFRSIRWLTALLMAGSFAAVGHAQEANADLQAIGRMAKQGQRPAALAKLNDYLAQHPKDLSARFMKGVFLVEQAEQSRPKDSKEARDPNRYREAISVFYGIIKDHPDHPEPYNNLAAIYASLDQWDKAKEMLEAAIRTNPSYATAHENLGDVYAKLASQAYEKALQLDTNSPAVQNKLRMISDLFPQSGTARSVPQQPQKAVAAASSPRSATTRHGREAAQPAAASAPQTVVAQASPSTSAAPSRSTGGAFKPTPVPSSVTPATPPAIAAMSASAHPEKSAGKEKAKEQDKELSLEDPTAKLPTPTAAKQHEVVAKKKEKNVAIAKSPEKAAPEKPGEKDSDEDELKGSKSEPAEGQQGAVLDVVRSWANTWSKQDVPGYLGYYGDNFKPSGQSRDSWKKQREERISHPKNIQVDVENAKVHVKGDHATVTFKQSYKSDVVGHDSMTKRLVLVKENGQWRIVRESGR